MRSYIIQLFIMSYSFVLTLLMSTVSDIAFCWFQSLLGIAPWWSGSNYWCLIGIYCLLLWEQGNIKVKVQVTLQMAVHQLVELMTVCNQTTVFIHHGASSLMRMSVSFYLSFCCHCLEEWSFHNIYSLSNKFTLCIRPLVSLGFVKQVMPYLSNPTWMVINRDSSRIKLCLHCSDQSKFMTVSFLPD